MLFLLLPAGVCAQTDEPTGEPVSETPIAVCDDEEDAEYENRFDPCDEYIDGNTRGNAETIKWMLEEIDDRKNYAQDVGRNYDVRDQTIQLVLIILSLLTTISAAITKVYPKLYIKRLDFAIVPIILSAMMGAVTSINAYYQFDEYRRLSQNLADDLTELETDINFGVLRHVASQRGESASRVDENTVNEWHERLITIMQRYSTRETGDGV